MTPGDASFGKVVGGELRGTKPERTAHGDSAKLHAVVKILGQQRVAVLQLGGGDNHAVTPAEPVA